jgi:hypothetical protein
VVPKKANYVKNSLNDSESAGPMHTSITLQKVFGGTEVNGTHEGVPDKNPAEACYLGWQGSLALLTKPVETELPYER